ncbi:flagellar biosynthesis protein FlhA [Oharaeibacter diazotrophicus]|uniref:Flagellar biosynthesis protein FlhA n=1 Tax=Oharaeibacter diazotrophicus TaxID=1920512 RepID=A0A4R6R9R1_9HYPH|nr:flagellar biosynthesis protein FlhA [Oharaeibacter diazotrophicus]TDP82729.1 flagellar biosynthesis protein FlhA [Oharaeibacter diazotrophicus]BBE72509.1 flagellar biosynthesis protein FlhA [Pleomorphomonas sp. SM30]GLS76540.1 flagellar biosynthesis protein FlhA [Oharaeibacter diazotrophicus]
MTDVPDGAGTGSSVPLGLRLPTLEELRGALMRGDVAFAVGVMAILVVLILPLPSILLDFFLAVSIIFSILILMTALFIQAPLEFSSFPTVLLIATMLRLALNLASTRLILSHGHEGTAAAGHVIQAFGNFVMGGNFVIGIIVFAILVIVNFVVITKGSGRIAEVAARFTLDAMPGKQMAIDADLSAGLIKETEARERRKNLEQESAFFGAMDGASKFVRGDAVAGLLITFINVLGGIVIGTLQMDLTIAEAGHSYTILTVGDGLVSQIPALIVSTAAGLLVSKAGVSGAADKALVTQLSGYPTALGMSAAAMGVLSILPGLPFLPFATLAAGAGVLAVVARRQLAQKKVVAAMEKAAADAPPPPPAEEPIQTALKMDDLRVELGYGLLPLINQENGGEKLSDQIKALRRQIASEMGFVMPPVRLLDNVQLPANEYVIKIKEVDAGRGTLFPNQFMVMDPMGGKVAIPGTQTTEPTFGLAATWVEARLREEAAIRGYTVVDPATVLSTHLSETLKNNMQEILSYGDVKKLLADLPADQAKLVDDLVPGQITISGIQRVLQSLLAERVSIRDLSTIMEGLAEAVGHSRSTQMLTEHVRARLARQICAGHIAPGGYLPLVTLSPAWEQAFIEALVGDGEEKRLAMAPSKLQEFVVLVRDGFEECARRGELPVLMTSPMIRPYVRSIVERFRAHTTVMSQAEVHPRVRLKTVYSI